MFINRVVICLAFVNLILSCAACGAATSAPNAPTSPELPAAVLLEVSTERAAQTAQAFETLLRTQNIIAPDTAAPTLQPLTLTIAKLPALPTALRLPQIAATREASVTEAEAEREALRRFVTANATLFGAETSQLSLIEITDLNASTRRALYEQKPFALPLRGGYGRITIDYTSDGHIINLSSTALPASEQVATQIATNARRFMSVSAARDAAARLLNQPPAALDPQQVVILPVPTTTNTPTGFELRFAWEIKNGDRMLYLDAVSGSELFPAPAV